MLLDLIYQKDLPYCKFEVLNLNDSYHFKLSKSAFGTSRYENSKNLIYKIKFDSQPSLVKLFITPILNVIESNKFKFDCVIPMPSSVKSYRERGYDHLRLLSKKIAKQTFTKLNDNLKITGDSFRQSKLNRTSRFNVERKFIYTGKDFNSCLLIDDVISTGDTMKHANEVLSSYFKDIYIVTLAVNLTKIQN